MAPQMLHACLSCATKKRSCDKIFPRCSRCSGSRSNQHCIYRGPFEGQPLIFDNGYIIWSAFAQNRDLSFSLPIGPLVPSARPRKSAFNCNRCRTAKRACSKDLPICTRCYTRKTPCHYELCNDVDQGDRSTPSQAWFLPDGTAGSSATHAMLLREGAFPPALSRLQLKPRYPMPERDCFPILIYYYTEFCCFPTPHVLQDSLMTHVHNVWVSRALADPCLFLTLLFAASAHRDMLQGTPHSIQTLYHQSQALKILRERVDEGRQISYEMAASAIALTFYSMSGYNTASARIHKSGVLQMLAENQHRGADFEALTALANLILLGLSMVVDEDPPLIPPVNTSKRIDAFAFEPDCMASNLLRKALIRVSVNQGCLLTSDTTFDLRAVLEFIASAERKSISELHILHKATILTRSRETTISETESAIMTTNKTAQIINTCCRLAINIFWSILRSTVLDRRQKSPSPSTSAGSTTSYSALAPLLETLRTTLRALDLVTWKKHAPEAYLWICLTAAAACDAPASRVPFVAVVPPLLTASDTTELSLARECWRYYKWLAGLATSCNASDVGLETSSLGLEYTLDYDML